ncbi:MAG: hypothetical protein LBH66_06290 [Oscillospiraceae bacterium]|jgi:hypothetical protein|nr:hypothetical protein [Oscillospiraceae bacterium]
MSKPKRRRPLRVILTILCCIVGVIVIAVGGLMISTAVARSNQNAMLADGVNLNEPLPIKPPPMDVASTDGATTRGGFIVTPAAAGERGAPFSAYYGDISEVGYTESEYFLSGVARHYIPEGELTSDGMWTLTSGSTLPYTTRILVQRPIDPARFNGTVIVEWANVSSGYDFSLGAPEGIYREGFAYVLVTAQPIGITGFDEDPKGLKVWDPERYAALDIPDEGLSYDIFTQAARAVGTDRANEGVDPMGGLTVERLVAYGASQSGSRIRAYANGVQPIESTFDALMPILDGGHASDFLEAAAHGVKGGGSRDVPAKVRGDLRVPVLSMTTQTEAAFLFGTRQPDSNVYRSWEITGSPHFPAQLSTIIANTLIRDGIAEGSVSVPDHPDNVDWYPVLEAAFVRVNEWMQGESTPPRFPPIQISLLRFTYSNDKHGNAQGGLRLPEITVPTATYDVSIFGGLLGKTTPFSRDRLAELYPTHEDYVAKVTSAAAQAREDGILLPFRAQEYIDEAIAADIP